MNKNNAASALSVKHRSPIWQLLLNVMAFFPTMASLMVAAWITVEYNV